MMYRLNFQVVFNNSDLLLSATLTTLNLTVLTWLFGTLLALPLAIGMKAENRYMRYLSRIVTELLRSIPLLALLISFHYIAPVIFDLRLDAFTNAVIVFSLSLSAFLGDVLRGSIDAIPKGHVESARALGMSEKTVFFRIIIPEVFRRAFPGIVALYISTYKLTSLASVIGVRDLIYVARQLNQESPAPIEVYFSVTVIYLLTIIPLSYFAQFLEKIKWFTLFPKSSNRQLYSFVRQR